MPTKRHGSVWALMTVLIVSACAGPSSAPTTSSRDAATLSSSFSTTSSVIEAEPGDPTRPLPDDAESVTVVSITDGDTIRVSLEGRSDTPVRLIGIDSPEIGECYGDEAAQVLAALVPEGTVIVMTRDVSDVDEFGRLLRFAWRDGMSVNEEMVRRGAAIARRYPPDTAMAESLELAQAEAADAHRGLWDPDVCGPHSDAELGIAEVEYDASGDDSLNLNEEWIVVRNDGDSPADLTGWAIRDESAGTRYLFPKSFTLVPGESVTVRSGCGDDSGTDLFWCSVGAAVWNNDGDTAFLLDPNGNIHASRTYEGR